MNAKFPNFTVYSLGIIWMGLYVSVCNVISWFVTPGSTISNKTVYTFTSPPPPPISSLWSLFAHSACPFNPPPPPPQPQTMLRGNFCDLELQTSNIEWGSGVFSTVYCALKIVELLCALKVLLTVLINYVADCIFNIEVTWVLDHHIWSTLWLAPAYRTCNVISNGWLVCSVSRWIRWCTPRNSGMCHVCLFKFHSIWSSGIKLGTARYYLSLLTKHLQSLAGWNFVTLEKTERKGRRGRANTVNFVLFLFSYN